MRTPRIARSFTRMALNAFSAVTVSDAAGGSEATCYGPPYLIAWPVEAPPDSAAAGMSLDVSGAATSPAGVA